MSKKNWIAGAVKNKGALTRQAAKSGESPMAFARSHESSPGVTGKRARLAVTLSHMHHAGNPPPVALLKKHDGMAHKMMNAHHAGQMPMESDNAAMTAIHQQMGGETY